MTPISPVIPGFDWPETVYAKDQPQYIPLPTIRFDDGKVISRWKLGWMERLQIAIFGNLWLTILTFNKPLQPLKLQTTPPEVECPSEFR